MANWAGNWRGLAPSLLSQSQPWAQCHVQLSVLLCQPQRHPLEGPRYTNPKTGYSLWSIKWSCCVLDGKGWKRWLKQSSSVLLMSWVLQKFFGGNRQKSWGVLEDQILFYRSLFHFLPMWVSFTCLLSLSTSEPVANIIFIICTKKSVS